MKIKYLIPLLIFALFSQQGWAPPTSRPQDKKEKEQMSRDLGRQDSSDEDSKKGAVGGASHYRRKGGVSANPDLKVEEKVCGGKKVATLSCAVSAPNPQEVVKWKFFGTCKAPKEQQYLLSSLGKDAGTIGFEMDLYIKDYGTTPKTDFCLSYTANIKPTTVGTQKRFPNTKFPLNIKAGIYGSGAIIGEKLFQIQFVDGDKDKLKSGQLIKSGSEMFTLDVVKHGTYHIQFEVLPPGDVLLE